MLPLREGGNRFSVVYLVAALGAMFVALPIADQFAYGELIESTFFTVTLLAAVGAVATHRWALIVSVMLAVPALLVRWLSHLRPDLLPVDVSLLLAGAFICFVILHLLRYVVVSPVVDFEVLCAAVSAYLLIAVVWTFVYTLIWQWDPNAFTFAEANGDAQGTMAGFNALYFSMQILTTITFGDILPVSNFARVMALVEAMAGMFYLAILISRLVGLYSSRPPSGRPES
jgi:hypothetical protein